MSPIRTEAQNSLLDRPPLDHQNVRPPKTEPWVRTGGLGVRAQNPVVQEGGAWGDGAMRAAHEPDMAQEHAKQGEQTPKETALSEPRSAIHLHRCQQVCPSAYVLPNGIKSCFGRLECKTIFHFLSTDITVLTPPVERIQNTLFLSSVISYTQVGTLSVPPLRTQSTRPSQAFTQEGHGVPALEKCLLRALRVNTTHHRQKVLFRDPATGAFL